MPMPMVQVRVVRVLVPHRRVVVPVSMGLASRLAIVMGVLVVFVVDVIVFVIHRLVSMLMIVAFGEVEPDADPHEHCGADKRQGDRFSE
jgi:hypothetical protein